MRYKHFKNADIDVSELAVGTWGLDSNRWSTGSSREEAIEAILRGEYEDIIDGFDTDELTVGYELVDIWE